MEKVLILCAFAFFLGPNSCTFAAKLDESYTRCAESCMKINPYENILRDGASHLVKHCAKLTSDGKCECDWEKVLTPDGDCVCRNPGQKINGNNQCVCDLSKCVEEPMKDCKGTLTIKEDPNGCCPVYTCEDCPSDSYPSNQTQDDTCLCYPCKEPSCKENLTTVVLRKGTLQPGTCCDLYKCEDLSQNKTCHWNGKTYWNGDAWLQDECTMYRCENGIIFHDRQEGCEDKFNCFSKGNVYAHEQTWLEDECTNCTCVNGRKKCVAHFCEELPSATIKPRLDDCPSMVTCRKTCAFGLKTNRRGCDLCKCKQPDVKTMQEILHKINCTVEWCDILRVLPPNRSAVNNSVSIEQCPKCAEPYSDVSFTIWMLFFVLLITIVFILSALLYCERRKRDCSMSMLNHKSTSAHPEYKTIPLAKYDANLNTEQPIYKKANHELDDFY